MYYLVVNRPLQSLGSLALMAAGLLVYYASTFISNVPPQPPNATPTTTLLKANALDRV
jgi:hypothetical protein